VIEPNYEPGSADQVGEVRRALREPVAGRPLRERLKSVGASTTSTVAISVCSLQHCVVRPVLFSVIASRHEPTVRKWLSGSGSGSTAGARSSFSE
jgi:hypothetical protein